MTKEIFRPCTLWGMTFDACKVVALNEERKESEGHHVRVCVSTPHHSNPYDSLCVVLSPHFMPPLEAFQEAITTIAKALNPPIWVMDAVLEAVKKEPNAHYLILDKLDSPYYERSMDVDDIKRGDYIQADCPLALQVLLGFTTEGVPV